MRPFLLAVAASTLILSCTTTREKTEAEAETAASATNEAACKKMCEVAGDAEENVAAVAACQEKCTAG